MGLKGRISLHCWCLSRRMFRSQFIKLEASIFNKRTRTWTLSGFSGIRSSFILLTSLGSQMLIVVVVHSLCNLPALLLIPVLLDQPFNTTVIVENVQDGFACVFAGVPEPCAPVIIWTMLFFTCTIGTALLSVLVQKTLGAASASVAISASIPLGSLLFLIDVFGGYPFSPFLIVALVLSVAGVILFRLFPIKGT